MIDIENTVFDSVSKDVRSKCPDIYMVGEYVKTPPKFPCVSLIEMDNQSYQRPVPPLSLYASAIDFGRPS